MEEKIVKSSQVKSKCAGPKAAPLGREQTKCRIVPDNLLYSVIFLNSDFIQGTFAAASIIQLSKPFQTQYFPSPVSQV